jgi:hypothetical protein
MTDERIIADADLKADDVPPAGAPWIEISRFALTCDGYTRCGGFERCGEIGNRTLDEYQRSGHLPADLETLRISLFFEQRRWRHFGESPAGSDLEYMRALVEGIRASTQG